MEHLLHVQSLLSAGFEVRHVTIGSAPRLRIELADGAWRDVRLVANDKKWELDIGRDSRVTEELLAPLSQVAEAGQVVQGESEEADVSSTIEVLSQALEAFPSTGIYHAQHVMLAVHSHLKWRRGLDTIDDDDDGDDDDINDCDNDTDKDDHNTDKNDDDNNEDVTEDGDNNNDINDSNNDNNDNNVNDDDGDGNITTITIIIIIMMMMM